jgi:hypothetical protein
MRKRGWVHSAPDLEGWMDDRARRGKEAIMTRVQGALVAVVCGVFLSLVLSGCDGGGGGDDGDGGAGDPAGFPDVRGQYTATMTWTGRGCTSPDDNGPHTGDPVTFTIFHQNGAEFRGDGWAFIDGQVTRDGHVRSTWTAGEPGVWGVEETHIGTLTGDTWTDEWFGRNTLGDTCVFEEGRTTATRQ